MTSTPAGTAEMYVRRQRSRDPVAVLLVDDDEAYLAAARELLEMADDAMEVSVASDGSSALRAIAEGDVDCVVSDYAMPGMDGFELAEQVASQHPEVVFLLFTGRGDEETARRAIRGHVDDYVSKDAGPDTFAVLADRIRENLTEDRGASPARDAWMNAAVGLAVHEADTGAFVDVNDHYCEMLGITRSQLLGSVQGAYGPEGGSSIPGRTQALVQASDGETATREEWVGQGPDGAPLWVEITLQPAEIGGQARVLASVKDVTPRREREDALRRMYETIADTELDFAGKVDRLMTLGRSVLGTGFATLSRLAGEEDYIFDHVQSPGGAIDTGDVVSIHETLCEDAVLSEETLVVDDPVEATNRTRGKALELSCYVGAPVYLDEEVDGTFCFYDVEPREQSFSEWEVTLVDLMSRWISAEKERLRIQDELERENERLEDFASLVSHDLRSPLAIATGHVGRLRDAVDHDSIGEALTALRRISEIVEDALTWARTGNAVDETQPVGLANAAQAAWDLVEHPEAQLEIETDQTIQAEETRLRQLFENLFRNAVEHGGTGVHVKVGPLERGVFVEDDGAGFPDDADFDLFEAGYSTAEDGTGFGLAIVEQIADAHGWTLETGRSETGGARLEIHDIEPVSDPDAGSC